MNDLIFPPEAELTIEDIKKVGQQLDIYARSQRSGASCPDCQTVSTYVHGRYWRHPQDLPCVDLEEHRPIDLLGSREADEVAAWFQAHPELEIISRDRGKDYIKAATEGAPQAEQVADRWRLLSNLREAVATFLQQKPVCLQAAAQVGQKKEELIPPAQAESSPRGTDSSPRPPLAAKVEEQRPLTKVEQEKAVRRARRQERYDQVRQLKQAGYSNRAISRHLKMSTQTVRTYIEADHCPQYPAGRVAYSKLTPWLPFLEQRWQAGCTNASRNYSARTGSP